MSEFKEGVYLEQVVHNIGTGATAKRQVVMNHYLVKRLEPGKMQVQALDMNDEPLPMREVVDQETFERRFTYIPDYFAKKKSPTEAKADKHIARAEIHVQKKEYFSAEFEYDQAIKLDEENVRANFGVAKVYLLKGEVERAKTAFDRLIHIEAVFEEKNKHIFNELGIELRRVGLFDKAIEFYTKALSFCQTDENLFFNVARAFFEKGQRKEALGYLKKALALNPEFAEARKMLKEVSRA